MTGRGVRVWMAWPWPEERLADLEAEAAQAGCGMVAPLGAFIERLQAAAAPGARRTGS